MRRVPDQTVDHGLWPRARTALVLAAGARPRPRERGQELPAEEPGQPGDREEMAGARRDPPRPLDGQAPAGDETVGVGMELEVAGPGVEHGGDAERRAQPPGIAAERAPGLGRRRAEEREEVSAVVPHEPPQRGRQGEDDGAVRGRQETRSARVDPAGGGPGLALGAVVVAADVVGRAGGAAGVAHVEMPAAPRRAAGRDGAPDGALVTGERVLASGGGPVGADDVGNLEGGTGGRRAMGAARGGRTAGYPTGVGDCQRPSRRSSGLCTRPRTVRETKG